jgi:paraquat-inducible protein B
MDSPPETDFPDAVVSPPRRRVLPLVWVVPLVAALIGIWLVIQHIVNEGPTITLRFSSAEGIEPGKTKIKYKDVNIGDVKTVAVSKDHKQIIITAKLVRSASDFLVDDTRFWVVRPRISAGGITGLNTLLSGTYIGMDIGKSTESRDDFVGLEAPPIVSGDLPGREFVLHGADVGSVDVGSPVYFRRISVGEVVAYNVDRDGKGVTLKVFVNAPYDQFVTYNARFWHASGIDLTLDGNGFRVDSQSLVSIVAGGLAFQTPPEEAIGVPAAADAGFTLYQDRETAMRHPANEVRRFVVYLKESLRGLAVGAPVDFHGLVIGEIKSLGVEYVPKQGVFRFPVELNIYPERMRARYRPGAPQPDLGDAASRTLVDKLVSSGMRAQLQIGSLVTGQMLVSLDFFPDARKATVDWSHDPPVLPAVPGDFQTLEDSLTSILKKVDNMPLDQLSAELLRTVKALTQTLADTDRLVQQLDAEVAPEAKAALNDARRSLKTAEKVLASDAPLQEELRDTLRQVSRSAQAVGALADFLERHPESLLRGKPAPAPLPQPAERSRQ